MDRYVTWRPQRLLIKQGGRNLRAGQADRWTRAWFHEQGLHQLMGSIRYPKARNHVQKTVGKPYAGKPRVRIEKGDGETRPTYGRGAPDYQWCDFWCSTRRQPTSRRSRSTTSRSTYRWPSSSPGCAAIPSAATHHRYADYLVAEFDWDDMDSLRRDFGSPLGQETARDVDTLTEWCSAIHSMIFELEVL
jgi:hypothetical protein